VAASITLKTDFAGGQGGGSTNYGAYAPDLDANFVAIQATVNQLVKEVRGVQGINAVLGVDILELTDGNGLGATANIVIGVESYAAAFISTTRVDVNAGVALIAGERVSGPAVQLAPVTGTDDGGTDYAYIALDSNGAVTINTAPGSQALDLWRVEVNGAGTAFVDNIQRVSGWQYGIDGDAWVEMGDWSSLGGSTFPQELMDEPKVALLRLARLASGFSTDLQPSPVTIGPLRLLPGTAALPGTILGDGASTLDTGTGIHRPGANRFGISTAGVARFELDAQGNLDLPTQSRVKGRRTATQSIADGGALATITFTAADVFDVGAWHDPGGGSPGNFTCPAGGDGTYLIVLDVRWAQAVTNVRDLVVEVQLNSVLIPGGRATMRTTVSGTPSQQVQAIAVLAASDVVRAQASQNDITGALALNIADASLSIVKLA